MCQFCVQHGDGEKWYLAASSYAADLTQDLQRQRYLIDFVQEFAEMRTSGLKWLGHIDRWPGPISSVVRTLLTERQKLHHFGQPVPIEECERILSHATSVVQVPCVCRTAAGTPERGYCLAITVKPADGVLEEAFRGYESGPDTPMLQHLDHAQAMELLARTEKEGLMHSVWTFETPFIGAICNCDLASGCLAMRVTLTHRIPIMWRGEWVVRLDEEACTGCGACVRRCPFAAIDAPNDRGEAAVLRERDCWGCGVCRSACAVNALELAPRTSVPSVATLW